MNTSPPVIVVGASHAGSQVALNLAKAGWQGGVTLIGDEPHMPYHRPPLSKDFLAGGKTIEQLMLRPAEHYARAGVDVRLGERVTRIDRTAKAVTLASGESLVYSYLVLATGARVRELPGVDPALGGVRYLRSAADIAAIQTELEDATDVAVIGGGYIGLEAAATMRKLGRQVTVIEAADRVLQRVTSPAMSAFFERVHTEEGVSVRTGCGVSALQGGNRLESVECADGERVAAQLAIVGIGVLPNVELAAEAGLATANGIVVDASGRTDDPSIYACGDCAQGINAHLGASLRLESVQNANDQGLVVAKAIAGEDVTYAAVPWFWSDQYDVKLQIAGLARDYDGIAVRGNPAEGRDFALYYLAGDRLVAVDAVNRPREFVAARQWLAKGVRVDAERVADPSVALPECVL